jgi:hypothetical protein
MNVLERNVRERDAKIQELDQMLAGIKKELGDQEGTLAKRAQLVHDY